MGRLRSHLAAFARDEDGQTVVIVGLMFTLMLGFTALAFDVGIYYAERRTLQDAVDAAALACVRAYSQASATSATAHAAAKDVLENYNLKGSVSRLYASYQVPAQGSETYYDSIVSGPTLKHGILPQLSPYTGCRVAVYIDVPTTLIKIANPDLQTIALNARAYAIAKGGMVPVVVPKYSNGPGPGNGDAANFIHHTMAEGSDYQCTVTNEAGCVAASTTSKGREFVLFGQGQSATNQSQFFGYIAPDIRDFQTANPPGSENLVHTAYNGVAPNASVQTLKDFEANWILEGYPGPDICTVSTTNFLPCAEVAVINGASVGIFIDPIKQRYKLGDKLLAQLYDGTVKTIPNFTINFPNLVVSASTQTVPAQSVSFTYSGQFAASSAQVTTTFIPDDGTVTQGASCSTCGDTLNPWHPNTTCGAGCSATSGTFASNPTPNETATSYTQTWSGVITTNVPKGIYVVFLKGVSSAPYAGREQINLTTVNVADQKRQFFIDTSDGYVNVASVGTAATYTISVTDGTGQNKWSTPHSSYPITLAIDQCPKNGSTTLTCFFGTSAPGDQTTTVTSLTGTKTLTVQTTGATSGATYTGWIRASGVDADGKKVTRVLKITTAVNVTAGGTTDYVDVLGFAVFEVTCVGTAPECPNDVKGKAISGWFTSVNDPALAIGKKYGLVPWETN